MNRRSADRRKKADHCRNWKSLINDPKTEWQSYAILLVWKADQQSP
ncbi:hypothetical protein ACOJBO_03065 [Rhizobium beringeri]